MAKVRPTKVGPTQVGLEKIGHVEIVLTEVGTAEVDPAEFGLEEVGTAEIGLAQVGVEARYSAPRRSILLPGSFRRQAFQTSSALPEDGELLLVSHALRPACGLGWG